LCINFRNESPTLLAGHSPFDKHRPARLQCAT
jgi:hypothetical protein